jgi:hypothetical protein
MSEEETSFDSYQTLLPNIAIKTAGCDLYRIGLSHYRFRYRNRSKLYNPLLVFTITFIVWIKRNLLLILRPESKDISIMMGDFSYFLGIRIQFNLFSHLFYLMSMISQIYHYWYYKCDIFPTYMKPFLMISGYISPNSIGLTDKQTIFKLIKYSKYSIRITKVISILIPNISLMLSLYI